MARYKCVDFLFVVACLLDLFVVVVASTRNTVSMRDPVPSSIILHSMSLLHLLLPLRYQ